MTTLRRELRTKFEDTLKEWNKGHNVIFKYEELSELLADAALEVRGLSLLQNAGPEWSILAGQDVTEEQVKVIQLRDVAPKMFEKSLGFSKPLPWWDGEKEWREFGEWVCAEYDKNKTSFGEYNIWRNTPYTKGGMSNNRIRGFPKEFYDSWDMFRMGTSQHKTDEDRPQYAPIPERIKNPRPANLPRPNIGGNHD